MDRRDNWNPGDDQLLAQIVLDYIRLGETQLQAFKKVSEVLKRTPAACGFRWNSTVRHGYTKAINDAKLVRNENRRIQVKGIRPESSNLNISLDKVLLSLLKIKQDYDTLKQEVIEKDKIIEEYKLKSSHVDIDELSSDMKKFITILQRSSIFEHLPEIKKEPAI